MDGNGEKDFSGDEGSPTNAALNSPRGVFVDGTGNIFIADTNNHLIRKVDITAEAPPSEPTPDNLKTNPETASETIGRQTATVTVLDQDGNPFSGAIVSATANGKMATVSPSQATTDTNGVATFKFRFGFITKDGIISFTVKGLTATISQE